MKIWFEVHLNTGIISKVEVERFNSKNVWVKRGYQLIRQERIRDAFTEFHPTYEEAFISGQLYLTKKITEIEDSLLKAGERLKHLSETQKDLLPDPPKYDTPLFISGLTDEIEFEVIRKPK